MRILALLVLAVLTFLAAVLLPLWVAWVLLASTLTVAAWPLSDA